MYVRFSQMFPLSPFEQFTRNSLWWLSDEMNGETTCFDDLLPVNIDQLNSSHHSNSHDCKQRGGGGWGLSRKWAGQYGHWEIKPDRVSTQIYWGFTIVTDIICLLDCYLYTTTGCLHSWSWPKYQLYFLLPKYMQVVLLLPAKPTRSLSWAF